MPDVNNTLVYEEDWATTLQDRLSELTRWKDICRVEYTDIKVLHNPYMTDASVQTYHRGSSYTMQPIVETDDNVTIDQSGIIPQYIDEADLAQSGYAKQMDLAESQGVLIDEYIESAVFADYANLTTFDASEIGGGVGSLITVSVTNIDDIIRAVKLKIRKAKGQSLAARLDRFDEAFIAVVVAQVAQRVAVARPESLQDHAIRRLGAFHEAAGVEMAVGGEQLAKPGFGRGFIDEPGSARTGGGKRRGRLALVEADRRG